MGNALEMKEKTAQEMGIDLALFDDTDLTTNCCGADWIGALNITHNPEAPFPTRLGRCAKCKDMALIMTNLENEMCVRGDFP